MANRYKTVRGEAEGQLVIEKPKFIAAIRPVENQEEAEAFLSEIRSRHWSATHNVPVYLLGERFEIQKYSDDGEPSGTAGVPVLQMLMKEGITNVALVITRYFGGIKLGTGGLVRAYTSAAKEALEKAGIVQVKDMDVILARVGYTYHGKLENLAQKGEFIIRHTVFEDEVKLEILSDPERTEGVKTLLSEVTSGSWRLLEEKQELERIPLKT